MLGKYGAYLLISILTIFGLEFGCFVALSVHTVYTKEKTVGEAVQLWVREHPWSGSRPRVASAFNPLTQTDLIPGTEITGLKVNKKGFFSNTKKEPERLPDLVNKGSDIFRIVILGGSSAAGLTANSNAETISAHLEKILKRSESNLLRDKTIEVLNFGVPGHYSFNEMNRFFVQVAFLNPDITINFDGYNDAYYANFQHYIQGIPVPVMNWADYTYTTFNLFHGAGEYKRPAAPPILTYFYLMAQRLFEKFLLVQALRTQNDTKRSVYEANPYINFSWGYRSKDPTYRGALKTNLSAIASYHSKYAGLYLAYLQPTPLRYKDVQAEISSGVDFRRSPGNPKTEVTGDIDALYVEKIIEAFDSFAIAFEQLDTEFKANANIRFFDIQRIFQPVQERVFNDVVHLNSLGNEIIANRMAGDILVLIAQNN
tara:strand:- start:297 stop:1580 length:1284 start_codon:yes stop_codon:yes gene_type:complete